MRYMSEQEFKEELLEIQKRNETINKKQVLKDEKNRYKRKIKLPSTSKLMAFYLFFVLNIILVYAMSVMYLFRDLTFLGVLITDVAAQVITYFIYSRKATIENSSGGIVYDMAMRGDSSEEENEGDI